MPRFTVPVGNTSLVLDTDAVLIVGVDSNGNPVPMQLGDDGTPAPPTGGATEAKQDTEIAAIGAAADAAVTNPASSASVIAALKGILTEEVALVAKDFATQTTLAALNTKLIADQSSAVPTNTAAAAFTPATTDGVDIFTLAAGERGYLQNHAATPLNYKFGTGCSTSSFSGRLPACSIADDGTSPPVWIKGWTGIVSVAKASGSAKYSAWKV